MNMNDKLKLLNNVSNPSIVRFKAIKLFGNNIELNISTHRNKKYMISGDFTNNKWVHFGSIDYQDFTKHNDLNRKNLFLKRNYKWKDKPKDSPAYLSYYLLW